jgi:uncharacterized protein YyaL (SSP411 family)
MASSARDKFGGFRNRLGLERSPYLLQHANNPVDWYAWGEEAFEKAKAENKPIFLSVGYSTCHWCHVMERESFEKEEIGKILNEGFVSIKVDREERPDVDRVYMSFIQATQGGGGWPMSVWLTPDLKPIVGGTYFPPEDGHFGRKGFKTILKGVLKTWNENHEAVTNQGEAILDALEQASKVEDSQHGLPHAPDVSAKCYAMLARSYDKVKGGFAKAPKFPQPVNFNFMFRKYEEDPTSETGKAALDMTLHTLRMMAKGGIYDHVGLGFHRYSTDADWHVPHFEKMLYDQAQLAVSYAEAYQITKEELFGDILREILTYVDRDLSDKSGGFYSAEDADSLPTADSTEKKEGAFCVWTFNEIQKIFGASVDGSTSVKLVDVFACHYNVVQDGNVDAHKDPHGELAKQNVLIVNGSVEETANKFHLNVDVTKTLLQKARQMLWEHRKQRPKPHLDNKIITAWNGLMMSGFARAAQALSDDSYARRAQKCAQFVREQLYHADTGVLLRSCYVDATTAGIAHISHPVEGFVDDYAMLIRGLLDLYEVCFDDMLLAWAERLQDKQDSLFWDNVHGGYYTTSTVDQSIVLRLKEDQDGAEPSSNSVSAHNLFRLACLLDKPALRDQGVKLVSTFAERLEKIPLALPEMVGALMLHKASAKQIIICGDLKAEDTTALLRCIHIHYLPNKVVLVDNGREDSFLRGKIKILSSLVKVDGKATAYVCENFTCKLPVNSVDELEKLLK